VTNSKADAQTKPRILLILRERHRGKTLHLQPECQEYGNRSGGRVDGGSRMPHRLRGIRLSVSIFEETRHICSQLYRSKGASVGPRHADAKRPSMAANSCRSRETGETRSQRACHFWRSNGVRRLFQGRPYAKQGKGKVEEKSSGSSEEAKISL
jgi:hypothetical protein